MYVRYCSDGDSDAVLVQAPAAVEEFEALTDLYGLAPCPLDLFDARDVDAVPFEGVG